MAESDLPTINDFLARLYIIRDEAAGRARQEMTAITSRNAAKGSLRSGATLIALATLIEHEFDAALGEILAVLRHMKSVAGIDYSACSDQAFLRARDLVPILRGATELEKWLAMIGRGSAAAAIDTRLQALYPKIEYRFRQFAVGLDQAGVAKDDRMTPTSTRFQQRMTDRRAWFHNEWFFKWHHIGGEKSVEIDQFNGRHAYYAGIAFSGSARDIYWQSIAQGLRKEVIDQFGWVEETVKGYDRSVAVQAIDECAGLLTSFVRAMRREAVAKDRILRGDGRNFPAEQDLGYWDGARDEDIHGQAEALKAALFPAVASASPPGQPASRPQAIDRAARPFQVALSFAGEQRAYVRQVAEALTARHIAVFYDEFEANTLWGKDGAEHFHQIFSQDTQYMVMFISTDYVAKAWTRLERRSAISQQMKDDAEYILPVRFDDTDVPGLPDTLQYLTADRFTPAELAVQIAQKIGVAPTAGKASDVPAPTSGALSGEVTFDYAASNGRYVIGTGTSSFETRWSKGSDTSIHLYNDPPSIHGIAMARGATDFEQISDASAYDFTSRSRMLRIGEIGILRNVDGFYAAVKILHIEDDSRGAASDALTMRYLILPNGESDFTIRMGAASAA